MAYLIVRSFAFLLLFFLTTHLPAQWVRFEYHVNGGLEEVYFLDQLNGVMVGVDTIEGLASGGKIWRTTDGGGVWQEVFHDDREYAWLDGIDFVNSQVGMVVGRNDLFFRTTDGGWTWDSIPHPGTPVLHETVEMVNQSIGYAGNHRGEVYKTTDGGLSWAVIYTVGWVWYPVEDIACLNSNECWLTGWGGTYLTVDGGQSWDRKSDMRMKALHCWDVANCLVVSEDGQALRTSDTGATWETIVLPVDVPLMCLEMIGNVGYIGGSEETILETQDGGQTWSLAHHRPTSKFRAIRSIEMLDQTQAYACGDSGLFFRLGTPVSTGSKEDEVLHTVFPHPVTDQANFSFGRPIEEGEFRLYDVRGKLLRISEVPVGSEFRLDGIDLPAGVYTYRFLENKEVIARGKLLVH